MSAPDIDSFVSMLVEEGADVVVQYGSSLSTSDPRDVDLWTINLEEDRMENVQVGRFDVVRLGRTELDHYREVLDPVYVTEPLLTGETRHGDATELQESIVAASPGPTAAGYCLRQSFEEFQKATTFARRGRAVSGFRSLGFSISYQLYATHYARGDAPIPYSQLRERVDDDDVDALHADTERVLCGEDPESPLSSHLGVWTGRMISDLDPIADRDSG